MKRHIRIIVRVSPKTAQILCEIARGNIANLRRLP